MNTVKIGVCIFEDAKSPRSGFCSIDGQEARYISGYHELSSETMWVTNLEFPVFKELNLLRLRHLTQAQYFRTSVRMLQAELGISDPQTLCRTLSTLFSRAASLGQTHFGTQAENFNYRFHQAISERLHVPGMTEPVQGMDPNAIQLIIDHSTQENQAMAGVKRPDRSSPVSFLFPRDAYGQWLLSRTYPIGTGWKNDSLGREFTIGTRDGKKVQLTETFIKRCSNYFENNSRAMFFRISVVSHESSHRAFASFGSGSREPRVWVAWPELLELLEYSVVHVYESFSTASGLIREYLPEFCFASGFGVSEGLLFENIIAALSSPVNRRNTAIGAYLRAYDRAACGRAAAHFHNAGFVVGSYSSGRIVLLLPEGQKARASQLALNYGLMPPIQEEVQS